MRTSRKHLLEEVPRRFPQPPVWNQGWVVAWSLHLWLKPPISSMERVLIPYPSSTLGLFPVLYRLPTTIDTQTKYHICCSHEGITVGWKSTRISKKNPQGFVTVITLNEEQMFGRHKVACEKDWTMYTHDFSLRSICFKHPLLPFASSFWCVQVSCPS